MKTEKLREVYEKYKHMDDFIRGCLGVKSTNPIFRAAGEFWLAIVDAIESEGI